MPSPYPLEAVVQTLWTRSRQAVRGEAPPQREAPSTQPVSLYLDAERFRRERELLRRLPVAVAPVADLPNPGDWLSAPVHGVPVLLARDEGGVLRAFLNVCRHRGALVAPEHGRGQGRSRFVCPYHSWTYDGCGRNVGRPHDGDFPHVPRADSALVPLPVAERLGLVWVVASTQPAWDWDAWFGPLGDELTAMGFDQATFSPHRRAFEQASNWKLVLEGNLESYHFQYAHQKTVGPVFHDNMVVHDQLGDHHRIVLPKRTLVEQPADAPVTLDALGRHSHIIYCFFPCTFVLWEGDHLNLFTVQPTAPDRSAVESWMLVPGTFRSRAASHWEKNDRLFWDALDEDFALAASIQRGMDSGANTEIRFGTNEFACHRFNETLRRHLEGVAA